MRRTKRVSAACCAALIAASIAAACSGKSSPSTPSSTPPATVVAAISITPLTVTREATASGFIYRVTFQLRETSGRSSALLTGVSYALPTGGTTDPGLNGAVIRIPAGGTYNAGTVSVNDNTGRGPASQITVRVTFTDDAGLAGSASATTDVSATSPSPPPAPQTFAITGTVTDANSRGVLPNIAIELADASGPIRNGLTSSAGTYSFSNVTAGTYTVTAMATSYLSISRSVSLTTNVQLDIVLQRAPAAPPPGQPSATLTCNRQSVPSIVDCINNAGRQAPTAKCRDGAYSCSQNRSGTCSQHGGPECYVCPGPLC